MRRVRKSSQVLRITLRQVMDFDRRWSARLQQPKGRPHYWLALLLAHTGDSLIWLALAAGLWRRGRKPIGRVMVLTVFLIATIVMLIKIVVRRKRPIDQRAVATMTLDQHSFPSGHAARSIGLAITLAPSSPWPIGWAIGVGLARVLIGAHYLSDVIAGWGIGLITGQILKRVNATPRLKLRQGVSILKVDEQSLFIGRRSFAWM